RNLHESLNYDNKGDLRSYHLLELNCPKSCSKVGGCSVNGDCSGTVLMVVLVTAVLFSFSFSTSSSSLPLTALVA
ncbi:hypothetical protein U1Q18_030965, partial [Sarracenia purpurea var. burkii]